MLPDGQGQFIAGVGYSEGSRRFNASGDAMPAPSYTKAEASGYLEYGLTSEISLILAPTLDHPSDAAAANSVTGSRSSAFGARVLLYGTPERAVALQALVEPFLQGATDVRLMLGQSFMLIGWPAFVDLDPGVRLRAVPFPSEARLDATVGVRPVRDILALLQAFTSFAPSRGPATPRQSYGKLQASLVYDMSRRWSVQLGAFHTLCGRNVVRETGPMAALWYRF